jgi:hypothetical protein
MSIIYASLILLGVVISSYAFMKRYSNDTKADLLRRSQHSLNTLNASSRARAQEYHLQRGTSRGDEGEG